MKRTRDELFREMLEREGLALTPRNRIERRPGARETEASFAQWRIWVNQMLERASTVYNIMLALKIEGPVSVPSVQQALQSVVDRHESLRTYFKAAKGRPYQAVHPEVRVRLNQVDIRDLRRKDEALEAVLAARQKTAFALEKGPLFEFTVVHVSFDTTLLLIVLHHIIFDFVSSQILFDEFSRLYESYRKGVSCALREPEIQYLDYSDWQRKQFDASDREPILEFWKKSIGTGDDIPVLDFADNRPAAGDASFQPGSERFVIPPEIVRQLQGLSGSLGVSVFSIWLAAFQLLLHRYTEADDVLVCVPHSERDNADLENVIGFFINLIALKLRVRRGQSFVRLLQTVHSDYLEAIGDKAYPFEKLVEVLSPSRYRGVSRLGEVGFGYQRLSRSKWKLGDLDVSFVDVNVPVAKAELSLSIYENPDRCQGFLEYNAARFSRDMISGMAENYCRLLSNLLRFPQRPVGAIGFGVPARQESLPGGDWLYASEGEDGCVHTEIAKQANAVPDRLAVAMNDSHISYGALNRKSAQIAQYLRNNLGAGSSVGVLLPRCADAYVCVLAIFKSGAVYVPMDRSHPPAYLKKIIKTADVSHLLVAEPTEELKTVASELKVTMLNIAEVMEGSNSRQGTKADPALSDTRTAYTCFTSGSKGESKGAFVSHRALGLHLRSFLRAVPIRRSDRVLQFAALTFDVSIEQICSAWCSGATLIPRGEDVWSIREFVDILEREQVTMANLPTAYWNQVVKICATSGVRLPEGLLRYMIAGGEAMPAETARLWMEIAPQVRLVNAYGPTESVITAAVQHLERSPANPHVNASIPIGRPLAGREGYILDRHGLPVPKGMPGELCLGGPALADGYLKSPRLTAIHFRPFEDEGDGGSRSAAGRVYCTGDRVRELPEHGLEFLRREDDEIKVRGVRVTPGLIESALLENEEILEAAVVIRNGNISAPPTQNSLLPGNEDEYKALLERVPAGFIEKLLLEAEQAGADAPAEQDAQEAPPQETEAQVISKHEPEFDLLLQFRKPGFIATPRNSQRNWVINRALNECADDLRALDELVTHFVPGSDRVEISGDLAAAHPSAVDRQLVIEGQQIMQDWQKPLMKELARAVTERQGDVLEIGFGMGLSAGYIQDTGARSHVVVEANEKVADAARRWRERYPDRKIRIINAMWQDVIDEMELFDGILFDTYPMSEDEFRRYVLKDVTFAEHCFMAAGRHLKPGGIFTYYSNEIDSLSRRHQRALLRTFSSFHVSIVKNLHPPQDSQNWWADSMAVVRACK